MPVRIVKPSDLYEILQNDGKYSVGDAFRSSSYNKLMADQATLDSALDSAFKNSATHWVEITVPKGTSFYEGAVSPVFLKEKGISIGQLLGGGNQIHFGKTRINSAWITSRGAF